MRENRFAFHISCILQGNLVRELKAKQDKSVWQPQVEILLSLKKKLADLKGSAAKAPEKKSPAKNKKADSTNVQKQNAAKLIDPKEKQPVIRDDRLPKVTIE